MILRGGYLPLKMCVHTPHHRLLLLKRYATNVAEEGVICGAEKCSMSTVFCTALNATVCHCTAHHRCDENCEVTWMKGSYTFIGNSTTGSWSREYPISFRGSRRFFFPAEANWIMLWWGFICLPHGHGIGLCIWGFSVFFSIGWTRQMCFFQLD